MYGAVLRSLTILISLSCLTGWVFIDYGFWRVFAITFISQIILGSMLKHVSHTNAKHKQRLVEIQEAAAFDDNGVEVTCAYCGASNFIPIQYKLSNDFKCQECGKENSVYVNITTAQVTEPLMIEPVVVNSYNSDMKVTQDSASE